MVRLEKGSLNKEAATIEEYFLSIWLLLPKEKEGE